MSGVVVTSFNATSFNARVEVTELLTKTLENVSKDLASRCIKECGLRYGFNSDEAIRELGLENLSLLKKKMSRKSVSSSLKEKKEKKESEEGLRFPMPFVRKSEDNTICLGLSFNRGLFTQCLKKHMENGDFCKGCQSEADKNASGCPDCGTVESRLNSGLYEFKDPKGRSPVSYVKVLNKMKLSCEDAIASAKKMGLEIPEEHLTVIEKGKKSSISRGRPKKVSGAVEAENVTDLFKKLSFDNAVIEDTDDTEEPIKEKAVKAKLTDEEKAEKRAALEKEREAKKEEREAERKAEAEKKKAEREAKLATAKAEEKKAREEKLAEEKKEREAKQAEEKKEREAKRAAAKAETKGAKAETKGAKAETKGAKAETKGAKAETKGAKEKKDKAVAVPNANPVVDAVDPVVDAPAPVEEPKTKTTVTRIQISGKQYLKSSVNILYDPDTKEEVGLWNPITKKIEELPEDEDEEEEEEDEYE
jgi:chemotaxis protein histidine kinase CheA